MLSRLVTLVAGAAAASAAVALAPTRNEAYAPDIWVREFRVPTADNANLTIFVRNKYMTMMDGSSCAASGVGMANRTVLLIAGATYPTSTSLDLALDGLSFADYLARSGYDVWLLDQRGYGLSSRPVEMSQPPEANPPICNTSVVAGDVATVASFIMQDRGVAALNAFGWSWGTSIMALFTSLHPTWVNKLVLYAPQWLRAPVAAPVGAYRNVTQAAAMARWLNGVPIPASQLIPGDWAATWWNATVALDPVGAAANPPVVRAPNGIVEDNHLFWGAGIPVYDTSALTMPMLLLHAEWDVDLPVAMTDALWANLTKVPNKRRVEIAQGTHTVVMEKNRMQLFRATVSFLDEPNPIALTAQAAAFVDFRGAPLSLALSEAQADAAAAEAIGGSEYSKPRYNGAVAAAVIMAIIAVGLAIALAVVLARARSAAGVRTSVRGMPVATSSSGGGGGALATANPVYGIPHSPAPANVE